MNPITEIPPASTDLLSEINERLQAISENFQDLTLRSGSAPTPRTYDGSPSPQSPYSYINPVVDVFEFLDPLYAKLRTAAMQVREVQLMPNSVGQNQLQIDSVVARHIVAGEITADKMNVTDLSAIAANIGTITAGNITLDTSGFIRGGATSYSSGTGFWMGYDGGAYKLFLGSHSGDYLRWDGTNLTIVGSATISGSVDWTTSVTNRPLDNTGKLVTATSSGATSGLYLGSDNLGFFDGATWKTYMDSSGNFYLGGTSGSLTWNGTTLAVSGTITSTAGTIGGFTLGTDYLRDAANSFGLASTVTGADDVRFWAGATFANRASAPFYVTEAGALVATSATITGALTTEASSVISGSYLTAGTVASAALANGAVTTAKIAALAVTNAELAASAVTTAKIAADAVTAAEIAAGAVGSTELAAGAVIAGKITAGTIVAADIAAGTITGAKIAATTITASNIAALTITAAEIAASTITAGKMNVSTLSSITADMGTITAGKINVVNGGNTITFDPTATNVILSGPTGAPTFTLTNAGAMTSTSGTIGGFTLSATTLSATSGGTTTTLSSSVPDIHFSATSQTTSLGLNSLTMSASTTSLSLTYGTLQFNSTAGTSGLFSNSGISFVAYSGQPTVSLGLGSVTNAFKISTTSGTEVLEFGSDVNLYRSAANTLKTDDAFIAAGTMSPLGLLDISGASAGQVKFPATQNASSDANTLDDYEEGTWTPTLGGSATYTTQTGTYTKIGNLVTLICHLTVNSLGTGSNFEVTGLPFTSNGDVSSGSVGYFASLATNVIHIACYVNGGSNSVRFSNINTAGTTVTGSSPIFGNGADVFFTVAYRV